MIDLVDAEPIANREVEQVGEMASRAVALGGRQVISSLRVDRLAKRGTGADSNGGARSKRVVKPPVTPADYVGWFIDGFEGVLDGAATGELSPPPERGSRKCRVLKTSPRQRCCVCREKPPANRG
ncbi:MAG: hypothetical protein AAGF73_14885 [Actinomycetota bacterium]